MSEFSRILEGLRKLWAEIGNLQFELEVHVPGGYDPQNPPEKVETLPTLCCITIPMTPDVEGFTLRGWVLGHHAEGLEAKFVEFRELCMAAGANLGSELHSLLRGYSGVYDRSPAAVWIALLLFLRGTTAYMRTGEVQDDGEPRREYTSSHTITEPLRDMIKIIEVLGLEHDSTIPAAVWFNAVAEQLETEERRGIHVLERICAEWRETEDVGVATTGASVSSTDGEDLVARAVPDVKRPKSTAFQSFKLNFLFNTQAEIAEQVYGTAKKQYQVSRDIKAVEQYLSSCGFPEAAWKREAEKPTFIAFDPAKLDLGPRQDAHSERQREKFEDSD